MLGLLPAFGRLRIMDGTAAVRIEPDMVVIPGQRAPDALREDAYQLWAWACAQNCEKVADTLNAQHPGLDLDGRTVRGWCRQEQWRVRYEEERAELVPGMVRYASALQLQNALPGAIDYVSAVAAGTVEPNKDRLSACKLIMDACGFAAIRVMGDEAQRKPADRANAYQLPANLDTLDADALERLERQYVDQRR